MDRTVESAERTAQAKRELIMRRSVMATAAVIIAAGLLLTGCTAAPRPAASPSVTAASAPSIIALAPATGTLVGGETVTLTGVGLGAVTRVTFNGVEATEVKAIGGTSVTASVPRAENYQPVTGVVQAFVGKVAVASATPLSYTWAAVTPVDRQMQYAFAHWDRPTYNLAQYGTFNPVGGDCMNFASQTLVARGIPMTSGWYYKAGGAHSQSWSYVPAFDDYLAAHPALGFTKLTLAQRDRVSVGDIAIFDWNADGGRDHVQIVSAVTVVDGVTKISLVGHNLDSDWRDLDTTITVDHPGANVWFWKVP